MHVNQLSGEWFIENGLCSDLTFPSSREEVVSVILSARKNGLYKNNQDLISGRLAQELRRCLAANAYHIFPHDAAKAHILDADTFLKEYIS